MRITAKNNAYQAVALIPWFVRIDHKEVKFDTNKAVIRDSEVASLKESLTKIKEVLQKVEGKGLGTITLFIAGHTDTRGTAEHNMTLSRSRAEAIAAWFQKQGLCIPIAYEGFGETALKKVTADEVDEQANRRVDYILSVEPPVIKKGATPAWKLMSKGCLWNERFTIADSIGRQGWTDSSVYANFPEDFRTSSCPPPLVRRSLKRNDRNINRMPRWHWTRNFGNGCVQGQISSFVGGGLFNVACSR